MSKTACRNVGQLKELEKIQYNLIGMTKNRNSVCKEIMNLQAGGWKHGEFV